ncbi:MAG: hypothetical protein ACYDEC_05170 [Bacteroidia bacterium]
MPNQVRLGLGNLSSRKSLHKKTNPQPKKTAAIRMPVQKKTRCIVVIVV